MSATLFIVIGLLILGASCFVGYVLVRMVNSHKYNSLNLKLIEIILPQDKEKGDDKQSQKERFKEKINLSEQLFNALLSLKQPFTFEASVHHAGEEIHLYASVPFERVEFVIQQIQGLFPNSKVEMVEDYNIFSPHGGSTGGYLALSKSFFLPIRTYVESEVDTFAPILSTMTKLRDVGEGAAIQVLVRPAPKKFANNVMYAIERLKKGVKLKDVLKTSIISAKDFVPNMPGEKKRKEEEPKIVDDSAVKTLQSKIEKPLFSVNMRLLASGESDSRAEDILLSIGGSYSQFQAPLRNSVEIVKPRNLRKLFYKFSFRDFDENQVMVLNSEELASLFHLPAFSTDVPKMKWLDSRESVPPENLPNEGIIIGESIFRGDRKPVRLTSDDRRRHFYIIGQTGTGKSGLMISMAKQDMEAGNGLCIIDPHGELVDDVLARVPKQRIDDVIVFDPGDLDRPLGLNMLEYDLAQPEQKTFIVNEIQAIFNRLFTKESMGPMFEQYMRNTLLLLMEDMKNEPATLVEVPRIFTDNEFRKRKLARITNPTVIDFWEKEASKTSGDYSLANMSPYITTKFGNFISNDYVRPIIGQPKSSFNFREIMDTSKILLVNLSKGKIGDINAGLLGMVITGRILMAALSRVDLDPKDRKDFYFYIDEFQNFSTDSISTILAEARKYRLDLVLGHQYIDQLTDEIRESVFGNVGSMAAFRVGVPDTEQLVKQFGPEFTERDLISTENRHAVMRILINGQPSRPFNIKTMDFGKGSDELKDKIKELSRLTYGKSRDQIEAEILARLRI